MAYQEPYQSSQINLFAIRPHTQNGRGDQLMLNTNKEHVINQQPNLV